MILSPAMQTASFIERAASMVCTDAFSKTVSALSLAAKAGREDSIEISVISTSASRTDISGLGPLRELQGDDIRLRVQFGHSFRILF